LLPPPDPPNAQMRIGFLRFVEESGWRSRVIAEPPCE